MFVIELTNDKKKKETKDFLTASASMMQASINHIVARRKHNEKK